MTLFAKGQDGYFSTFYNTENGLPSCIVHNIFQDSRNFLWITTDAGICRYDGRHFTNYSLIDGLFGTFAVIMREDAAGNLWIVTNAGLTKFDGVTFSPVNFNLPDILDMLIDSGKIWLATKKGLYIYDISHHTTTKQDALGDIYATRLLKRSDGSMLIGTRAGIWEWHGRYTELWQPQMPKYVYGMTEDHAHTIWFCTLDGGIYTIGRDGAINMNTDNGSQDDLLTLSGHSDLNGSILVTKDNDVLIGHYFFFTVFRNGHFAGKIQTPNTGDNLSTGSTIDKEGIIWLASFNGLIAMRPDNIRSYKIKFNKLNRVFHIPGDSTCYFSADSCMYRTMGDTAAQVFRDIPVMQGHIDFFVKRKDTSYLFGSMFNSLLVYKNGKYKDISPETRNHFFCMIPAQNGTIYFGAVKRMYELVDDSLITYPEIPDTDPNVHLNFLSILPLRDTGHFLIGTQYGLYSLRNGVYKQVPLPLPDKSVSVCGIIECGNSTYMLATKGYGLLKVKLTGDSLKIISALNTKNRLGTNSVISMQADGNRLWLTGANGIYRINNYLNNPEIEYINQDDGMVENSWPLSSMCFDDSGYAYVGGSSGLVRFQKDATFSSPLKTRTYITSITVNDKQYKWPDTIAQHLFAGIPANYTFSHNQNSLVFYFTGINMARPKRVTYEYQLAGYQQQPVITNEDHAVFTNLSHGDYVFKVRATANQQFTDEPWAYFRFTVRAPFWLTWWFNTLLAALALSAIYAFYRWRLNDNTRKQRRELEVMKRLNESKMLAFQARMNPHFIFNSLAAIQYFITKGEKLSTLNYLSKFAKLLRQILDNTIEPKISLDNEIAMLRSYIEIEEMRFENRFDYELTVDESLASANIEIPGMVIQPFVENAILHGLLHKTERGLLKIHFYGTITQVICTVSDNGIGRAASAILNERKAAKHHSHGSSIAAETLRLLNDKERGVINDITFIDKQEDGKPAGTTVIIKIPML